MRRTTIGFALSLLVVSAALGISSEVQANKLDLSLARFITCNPDGSNCTPDLAEYEKFMAEYSLGLAPKMLTPAETLGYSGFYLGLEGTITPRPGTKGSKDRWKKGTVPVGEYPNVMFMPTVRIRKGLPWSMEIGSTVSYLAQSELVGLGGEVKWSLFEGYRHKWRGALPDLAARGTIVRVLGQSDVDMTIIGVDGTMSYTFGIGGMISLAPYVGYQYLWTIIRVEPLVFRDDNVSPPAYHTPQGEDWNTNTLSGPNLGRSRLFFGFRFGYEMLALTFEVDWALKNRWQPESTNLNADKVSIGHQVQISGGIGIDF